MVVQNIEICLKKKIEEKLQMNQERKIEVDEE